MPKKPVKPSRCQTGLRLFLCAVLLGCTVLGSGPASAQPDAALLLRESYYLREVAIYCGLLSASAEAVFKTRIRRLIKLGDLTEQQHQRLRMQAWTAADREWSNRGLGGFRGWCRTEGRSAQHLFSPTADTNGP